MTIGRLHGGNRIRLTVHSAPSTTSRSRLLRALTGLNVAIASLGRDLYRHPELSEEEHRSAALLVGFLAGEGFRVREGIAGLPTAFVATKAGRRGGPRVAVLAEYDALPGIGHACGHHLIGAAACGAAAAVGRVIEKEAGEIVVIGTPAEETIGGKVVMADRGVFRGLDAALMFHPSTENRVYTTSLACHSLEVIYKGKAAHAVASPETGINALQALLHLFSAVDRLKRRLPPEVRMPGVILEGGRRANIVPDRAVARFSLRAADLSGLRRVERAFRAAVRAAARATGARAVVRAVDYPYAEMVTNRTLADLFKQELALMGRRTIDTPRKRMGSLDMGNVSYRVPSIHAYIAVAPRSVPLHSVRFARYSGGATGRAGLRVATRALACVAHTLLADGRVLESARREFRAFRRRPGKRTR